MPPPPDDELEVTEVLDATEELEATELLDATEELEATELLDATEELEATELLDSAEDALASAVAPANSEPPDPVAACACELWATEPPKPWVGWSGLVQVTPVLVTTTTASVAGS